MLHWCLEAPPETERVWGGLCSDEKEHDAQLLEVVMGNDILIDLLRFAAHMVEVTHYQTVQHTLALQAPMTCLPLVVLGCADTLQHHLRLIEAAGQRVLHLLRLGDATAGQKPAVLVDFLSGLGSLSQTLEGLYWARLALSRLVLLDNKHLLSSPSKLVISVL